MTVTVPAAARMMVGSCTFEGATRTRNEDRVGVVDGRFACVCDGMGGRPAGGLFAEATLWQVLRSLSLGLSAETALRSAHDAAHRLSIAMGIDRGAGATAACVALNRETGEMQVARAGDLGVFLVGKRGVRALLTPESARNGEGRITSYVGMRRSSPKVDLVTVCRLEIGEALVVVTDGIADVLGRAYLGDIVRSALAKQVACPSERAARDLALAATAAGSSDDVTALVIAHI